MTNKELIKLLKDNRYPFGMWTDPECYGPELGKEMQEKAREMQGAKKDPPIFEAYAPPPHGWLGCHIAIFADETTYRLRPDYQEESEIVECRISLSASNGRLSHHYEERDKPMSIDQAFSDPDFIGFKCDGWIWGCLYKNKKDPSMVHYMIKESDLLLYDVISLDGGKVLFRRQT